jgi:hypothetical protein
MKSTKYLLKQTARILSDDVSHYRNVILSSGGGEFPPSIVEKKKLLQDIERLIKDLKASPSR